MKKALNDISPAFGFSESQLTPSGSTAPLKTVLEDFVVAVLMKDHVQQLLRRLALLQEFCDQYDIEGIYRMYELLLSADRFSGMYFFMFSFYLFVYFIIWTWGDFHTRFISGPFEGFFVFLSIQLYKCLSYPNPRIQNPYSYSSLYLTSRPVG